MKKLMKWFGLFLALFFQVILSDSPSVNDKNGLEKVIWNPNKYEAKITGTNKMGKEELKITDKKNHKNYQSQNDLKENSRLPERKVRSAPNNSISFQFERYCREYQPCTCYYPDHPNVITFELSNDETTTNASGINGTGPRNCEDLERLGYFLEGFHMVRLNLNKVKTIYCKFNQTKKTNTFTISARMGRAIKDSRIGPPKQQVLRFCGGIGKLPCTFYYSDHPDAPVTNINRRRNNVSNIISLAGPNNCEKLKQIGYELNAFYMVRSNTIKLKIMYCDFHQLSTKKKISTSNKLVLEFDDSATRSNVSRFCNGVGSQPCSCYYSKQRDIIQFELSTDEITRNASTERGTGPGNCKDLKKLGHTLEGFYLARFKDKIMKIIFCKFSDINREPEKKQEKRTTKIKRVYSIKRLFPVIPTTPLTMIEDEEEEEEPTTQLPKTRPTSKPTVNPSTRRTETTRPYIPPTQPNPSPQENGEIKDCYPLCTVVNFIQNPSLSSLENIFRFPRNTFDNGRRSFPLKNKNGKCLAVSVNSTIKPDENGARIIQSICNLREKGQLWRIIGDHLCNEWNKCLSLPNNGDSDNIISNVIHADLDSNSWKQKWKFQNPGYIMNYQGRCLNVNLDSDSDGEEVNTEKCNNQHKGQWWFLDF